MLVMHWRHRGKRAHEVQAIVPSIEDADSISIDPCPSHQISVINPLE